MDDEQPAPTRAERLTGSLRRVILMRETGPKRAAWHRARVQTIWRLHRLLEAAQPNDSPPDATAFPGSNRQS